MASFLFLSLLTISAYADAEESYLTLSKPTMAAFYTVDEAGRSQPIEPVTETISKPGAEPSKVIVGLVKPIPAKVLPAAPVTRPVRAMPVYDLFTAARCELAGFYFSRDGRCVPPVTSGVRQLRSRPMSESSPDIPSKPGQSGQRRGEKQ